jgi:hypothetical protein
VIICLNLCAWAIAGGIYLIVELADPTTGILRTPAGPLVAAARTMVP